MKRCMEKTEERIGSWENQKFNLGHVKTCLFCIKRICQAVGYTSVTKNRYSGVISTYVTLKSSESSDSAWLSRESTDGKRSTQGLYAEVLIHVELAEMSRPSKS